LLPLNIFLSNRVMCIWNNLPDVVIHSRTLSTFGRRLSTLDLSHHNNK